MCKGKFLLMDERTLARRSLMKQVGVLPKLYIPFTINTDYLLLKSRFLFCLICTSVNLPENSSFLSPQMALVSTF